MRASGSAPASAGRPTLPLLFLGHMGGVFAYLDPGSGSMILQAVVGGVAAVAVFGKFYWRRFLRFLGVKKEQED